MVAFTSWDIGHNVTWTKSQDKNLNILRMKRAVEVACMINLKLDFTDWFFYNLIVLITLYKIQHLNQDKAIISKELGNLSEKLKTLTSSNHHRL